MKPIKPSTHPNKKLIVLIVVAFLWIIFAIFIQEKPKTVDPDETATTDPIPQYNETPPAIHLYGTEATAIIYPNIFSASSAETIRRLD